MINSKSFRLALVALAASAAALTAVPAQAAPVQSQDRIQSVATAQVASLVDSPISTMRCRDDGQGCPPLKNECGRAYAPTAIDVYSNHILARMAERTVTQAQIEYVVRTGAGNAWCQVDEGTWYYEEPVNGRTLGVVVGWNKADKKAVGVTTYWKN
ncbi:hypothetical protein Slala03_73710 [Streptomyces lavendulae subsp. lavendulae]|uniref:DUF4258 domain-containing protein n=1 Tax=Streptomyces lavendulae TaxID=1914 RepID=UPI00249FA705|nr:DUF4258 domain-containing protein [Streptomyces lavendulae]GLV87682.1 hypothetical protein Slala03_73710 [Streptomyces lavendulae subsp. lavendulae]GLX40800.1 hypothetical protein Sros01_68730 [Streptomyces roseochromogenus]